MKKILIAMSALALTSCEAIENVVNAPAPCSVSTVDEKSLIIALQTFDALLTSVDKLVAAKVIVPGSPRAVQIANAIQSAKFAYQAASAAQRVCDTHSYLTALAQAQIAVGKISTLVKGG
jgi:hypothetical protein